MRALIQRVRRASVVVGDRTVSSIGRGLLVLIGVRRGDTEKNARMLAARTAALRIFNDAEDKMNLSVQDVGGSVLVVSQFTLHADTRKGNRPSYILAEEPERAEPLIDAYVDELKRTLGPERVASGVFRAMMQVELVNDGPVTILLRSKDEYAEPEG
ncbi:MAG: D-aminoacyl-tRNA deacylase [Bacteroidota bacterium]|nr:D-aminoacyl-tRNA deacylase [Bacteroidota bacterium]